MLNVLLGVSGSIACYKAAVLTRLLRAADCTVRVMMTPTATQLVGASTFRALSAQPVLLNEWETPQNEDGMDHIAATRNADLLLVAPASANFIAKAAAGIADNLLLTTFLAANCPRYVAPAMNQQMWRSPTNERNIKQLENDNVIILGPDSGEQACAENGPGRMLEAEEITKRVLVQPWRGKRVIINTGATVERLDAMRTISNRSSGKMGFCLAQAAAAAGADVRLIAAQTTVAPPPGIPLQRAIDNDAMRQAVLEETKNADWFFAAAAVADFRPTTALPTKAAREKGGFTLTLSPTADILAQTATARPTLNCLGFAAESGDAATMEQAARKKMKRKQIGWLALNAVEDAGQDDCQITLLHKDGKQRLPRLTKKEAARRIVAYLVSCETIAANVSHETTTTKE